MQAVTLNEGLNESESSIVKRHERLIRFLARSFSDRGMVLDDLLQEGRIALLSASRSWSSSYGVQLWTYARRFVLGAMFRLAANEIRERSLSGGDEKELEGHVDAAAMTPEEVVERAQCLAILAEEMHGLTSTESRLLRLHFEGTSLRDLETEMGASHTGLLRTYHAAIAKLRERVGARV